MNAFPTISVDDAQHGCDEESVVNPNNPMMRDKVSSESENCAPTIAILLATYNGAQFLAEQLDSIAMQSIDTWMVWVSDDGSTDSTPQILDDYRHRWGLERLKVVQGPGKGFVANFLQLVCDSGVSADFYAFCDQDDIWESDKLERALTSIADIPDSEPALYCSRTLLVDAQNVPVGRSLLMGRPPSFANSLVQSIAGGNTMLINDAARKLLVRTGKDVRVAVHDWWTYQVVSGCGGRVVYDTKPSVRYRQHGLNLVGGQQGWLARLVRVRRLLRGDFRRWSEENIEALGKIREQLTPANQATLDQFALSHEGNLIVRFQAFIRSGVYRQSRWGNIGLIAAFLFKQI